MRILILSLLFIFSLNNAVAVEGDLACNGHPRSDYKRVESNGNSVFDPPPGEGPTQIDVGFHMISLADIDVIRSRFRFKGYVEFEWCDSRQAFDESLEGKASRLYFGGAAKDKNRQMWIPDLAIADSIGTIANTARRLEVRADGTVRISGYFESTVAARFDLRHFPFDRQSLVIAIESFTFNRDVLQLRPNENLVSYEENLYLPEWSVRSVTLSSTDAGQVRDRVAFSRLEFDVNIERETGYYLFKLSVPLILIVMLSWSVFWMRNESLGGRMRISSTAFLTIVAYQFAVSGSLPKVAYLTLMDKLMIASFILIALSALENMVSVLMAERNPERARKIDRRSQWIFPLVYMAMIATVALVAA
jgi:hypothetical protein